MDEHIAGAQVALSVEQLTAVKIALALHLVKVEGSHQTDAAEAYLSTLKISHNALLEIMDSTYELFSDVLNEIEVTSTLPDLFEEVRRLLKDASK